jgi:hypothetical protein
MVTTFTTTSLSQLGHYSFGNQLLNDRLLKNDFPTLKAFGYFDPLVIQLSRAMMPLGETTSGQIIQRLRQIVDVHARTPEMEALLIEWQEAVDSPEPSEIAAAEQGPDAESEEEIPVLEGGEVAADDDGDNPELLEDEIPQYAQRGGDDMNGYLMERGLVGEEVIPTDVPRNDNDGVSKREIRSVWSPDNIRPRSKVFPHQVIYCRILFLWTFNRNYYPGLSQFGNFVQNL